MQVLSTKLLTSKQRKSLQKENISFKEYAAIRIVEKDFKLPKELEYLIFTSQNAVRIFLREAKEVHINLECLKAFCVGEKTAALLKNNGIRVLDFRHYAAELAELLVKEHSKQKFTFFCGEQRHETLPQALSKNKIDYREIQLYKTQLQPKIWNDFFNVILFFSPTGIQSFLLRNELPLQTTAICIGTTTADSLKNTKNKILIAEKPTVESVLKKTIGFYQDQKIK